MVFELQADTLPAQFVEAVEANLGISEAGAFLQKAVDIANKHAAAWDVELKEVLTGGVLSLCVLGIDSSGRRVVMKVPRDCETGCREIDALRMWKDGVPRLRRMNVDSSAFLMEYVPSSNRRIEANEVFALADSLHRVAIGLDFNFPSLRSVLEMRIGWAEERFSVSEYAHLKSDLELARHVIYWLHKTTSGTVLLHGDFQRKNFIVSPDGLRTLDPLPCIGDPVFDSAFWLGLVQHDAPLQEILKLYAVGRSDEEFRRFLCWTWAMSVVENRPYENLGTIERAKFISELRDRVQSELRQL